MQNMNDYSLSFLNNDENKKWQDIQGWLLPDAAEELYRLARESDPDHVIVEIGSYAGKSAVCLARAILDSSSSADRKLFTIDIQFQHQFDTNLANFGVQHLASKIQASSLQAADNWAEPVSFIYIDGNHGIGHAFADFSVWDTFLVNGGYMALDDTAGFYPGCVNSALSAVNSGCYEKISDLGGVTFLRKIKISPNNINYFPLSAETLVSSIVQISSWIGAMDSNMTIPVRQRGTQPVTGKEKSDLLNVMQIKLNRILKYAITREQLELTLLYLQAIIDFHSGRPQEAIIKLKQITGYGEKYLFIHFNISISEMALLRLGQLYDISRNRTLAIEYYQALINTTQLPELARLAQQSLDTRFSTPEFTPGILLREYITLSPLMRYRAY